MTNVLEVVAAGAGSGKTTDLCNTVAAAVTAGLNPARILATTFTKKAAAELKGRIQAKLLDESGHEFADRLELAAIGTVHSVAHHLLHRYAIELGLSPRLEVIEHGTEQVLSDLLTAIPTSRWEPLSQHAERLGVTNLPAQILALLAAKRGNRIDDTRFRDQITTSAGRVCELLAPDGPATDAPPISQLASLAEQALIQLEELTSDTTNDTRKAKLALRRMAAIKGALWGTYVEAMKIKAGRRSGANDFLEPLRLHAGEVRRNPQLHQDVKEFSRMLADETLALESEYIAYKAERGLVDFTDLETILLQLLEDEALAKRLEQDFDFVVVDEFQDTNPLQLAIFQHLRAISKRSRWVGDSRQAIYGFRDTDPRLVSAVWNRVPDENRSTLPKNHRSQAGLVQLVGELFSPHFDEDPSQVPTRPSEARGVERWILGSSNSQNDAMSLACGIAQLRDEGVRFGDIAVLERNNAQLKVLSSALDELGIPYLIESPGLFSTREGITLLAGLRLIANRNDSLAAATVLHLSADPNESTPQWLADRLSALANTPPGDGTGEPIVQLPWEGHEILRPLEAIEHRSLSPSLIVQQVLEAMALPKRVHAWGDSARRCSNLDSVIRHAKEYEDTAIRGKGSATLSGLILYLEQLAAEENDLRFTSQGHDAVTLLTYHGAKGLEWPVVILSGLHSARDPDLWKPVVRSPAFQEDPLANRELRFWTWPFGMSDGPFARRRSGSGLEDDALASPEGQEQIVREDEENLRLLYVGCTRARQKLIFAHRGGRCQWLESLANVNTLLSPDLDAGEHPIADIDTTLVIRHLDHESADDHRVTPPSHQVWFAEPREQESSPNSQRFHSPSLAVTSVTTSDFVLTSLPGDQFFPAKSDQATHAQIGNAVHSYLAALPSLQGADERLREQVAVRCITAFGVDGLVPSSVLIATGQRFCDWVDECFPGATWHTEVPVSAPRSAGGQWSGSADLLLQLADGDIVIVDHKSAPIRRNDCETKAATYAPQLDAYREILMQAGENVCGVYVHFPLAGAIVSQEQTSS